MYTQTLQNALEQKRVHHENRILRMAELKKRVGLSRTTIYQAVKNGGFPKPISLGARSIGWLESDIDSWLADRIKASRPDSTN